MMLDANQELKAPLSAIDLLQILKFMTTERLPAEVDPVVAVVEKNHSDIAQMLITAKLAGQFYALTKGTSVLNAFTLTEQETLRNAYERQHRSNRRYLKLLSNLRDQLTRQGIDLLLLKGLFIAQRFSGGMDRRFMWDADILVHQHQLRNTVRISRNLGLTASASDDALPIWAHNLLSIHAVEVSERGQAIDIHWHLRNRLGYHIDYDRIWRDVQTIVIDGQTFNALSDEDTLALAILEISTDIERGHIKLRSLWDSYQILRTLDGCINWEAFLDQRRNEGLLQLSVNMLTFFLYCMDCHSEYPSLVKALQQQPAELLINSPDIALQILERPKQHLANRVLYARLQPYPEPVYWIWWLSTAPLRFILKPRL